jgi:hypothetical protein
MKSAHLISLHVLRNIDALSVFLMKNAPVPYLGRFVIKENVPDVFRTTIVQPQTPFASPILAQVSKKILTV